MKTDVFYKIKVEDLSDQVYKRLKKAITTNALAPKERIDINDLSEQLGVSRTPIKDAISRLSVEGLVTVLPKKGTYVTPFTTKDMSELFSIRLMLEAGFCHHIIHNVTLENLKELENIIRISERALEGSPEHFDYFFYNDLDAKFHEELMKASGNERLVQVYRSLNFHTQVARYYFEKYEEKLKRGQQEHIKILKALSQKDTESFEQHVREHILAGQRHVLLLAGSIN